MDDSCRLPVELQGGSFPPLAGVHGLPIWRLLVAQTDKEIIDDALDLRHVAVECLKTRVFAKTIFKYLSQVDNDMDQITEQGRQVSEHCRGKQGGIQ